MSDEPQDALRAYMFYASNAGGLAPRCKLGSEQSFSRDSGSSPE